MLQDHQSLLDSIKLEMLQQNVKSIWKLVDSNDDKRNFVIACEKMSFVKDKHSLADIKKLAEVLL